MSGIDFGTAPIINPALSAAHRYAMALCGPLGYHHQARDEAVATLKRELDSPEPDALIVRFTRLDIATHTAAVANILGHLGTMAALGVDVPDLEQQEDRH